MEKSPGAESQTILDALLKSVESSLFLPSRLRDSSFSSDRNDVLFDVVSDASVLTCGCIISETLALQLANRDTSLDHFGCPVCGGKQVKLLGPVLPLRKLSDTIEGFKKSDFNGASEPEQPSSPKKSRKKHSQRPLLTYSGTSKKSSSFNESHSIRNKNKMSLISLFQVTALKLKDDDYQEPDTELVSQFDMLDVKKQSGLSKTLKPLELDDDSSPRSSRNLQSSQLLSRTGSVSSNRSSLVADTNSMSQKSAQKSSGSITTAPHMASSSTFGPAPISISDGLITENYATTMSLGTGAVNSPNSLYFSNTPNSAKDLMPSQFLAPEEDFSKEYRFANNFPVYRKRTQFSTQPSKMKSLLKRSDYIGTSISPDATKFALIDDKKWMVYVIDPDSSLQPHLLCCGKNNGHYGINFENMKKLNSQFYTPEVLKKVAGDVATRDFILKGNWLFEYCALSDNFLVVAGKRIIRVFDLGRQGKPVYTHNIGLPIRCIDLSVNHKYVACGLTGKDKITDSEGSLIMLFELFFDESSDINTSVKSRTFTNANLSLITLHYKDPINIVKFSSDAKLLSVSTALESRFMVINVSRPADPRLVMKASRKLDTSYESEGITDLCFFGDNNKYLVVSSVAFNAPSLILETRISNLTESQSVAHPRMLLKVEEIGSSIHKCCVSPRNDAFAFLNKKGSVYIMHINNNFERKRIVLAGDVMSATKMSEAASLRFSKDGYKLYIIDRKGILYVEDFIAGTPQSHDVTKCKSIL